MTIGGLWRRVLGWHVDPDSIEVRVRVGRVFVEVTEARWSVVHGKRDRIVILHLDTEQLAAALMGIEGVA